MNNEDFKLLYEKYFDMVSRIALSYMKNPSDAEDVCADVFSKLLKKRPIFETEEHEKAWLLRTTINRCKDNLKHWWRKRSDISDHPYLQTNPLQENHVLDVVLTLPKRYKDVVYLHYYEGYSAIEIAKILEKPYSTVTNHMSEARKLLREVLKDE